MLPLAYAVRNLFRVPVRFLGKPVMGQMEIPEPIGRQKENETADAPDQLVDPDTAKRGAMHHLVQKREKEHLLYAKQQHQKRPARPPPAG